MSGRTARWNQQRLAAQFDRLLRRCQHALEADERHIAGGEETPIDRTKMAHHSIVGLRDCVAEVRIPRFIEAEIAQTPGRENQLAGETQLIEGPRPVFATK